MHTETSPPSTRLRGMLLRGLPWRAQLSCAHLPQLLVKIVSLERTRLCIVSESPIANGQTVDLLASVPPSTPHEAPRAVRLKAKAQFHVATGGAFRVEMQVLSLCPEAQKMLAH